MAPQDMGNVVEKVRSTGNRAVTLTERGHRHALRQVFPQPPRQFAPVHFQAIRQHQHMVQLRLVQRARQTFADCAALLHVADGLLGQHEIGMLKMDRGNGQRLIAHPRTANFPRRGAAEQQCLGVARSDILQQIPIAQHVRAAEHQHQLRRVAQAGCARIPAGVLRPIVLLGFHARLPLSKNGFLTTGGTGHTGKNQ